MTKPPAFTAEVLAAMEAQGLLPADPTPPPAPQGQVRYHVAVDGYAYTQGTASPITVAAQLRAIAAQLEQGEQHG